MNSTSRDDTQDEYRWKRVGLESVYIYMRTTGPFIDTDNHLFLQQSTNVGTEGQGCIQWTVQVGMIVGMNTDGNCVTQ